MLIDHGVKMPTKQNEGEVSRPSTPCNETVDNNKNDETFPNYYQIIEELKTNQRWLKEIALGRRVGFYRFRGDLGAGNFSKVKVAIHQVIKERVAVKVLDKAKMDQKTQKMLSREISTMESLNHPSIIKLFEVVESLTKIYLVMEYASGGELFHKVTFDGRLSENEAKPIFAQILSAVDYMHGNDFIHRDLKAENVFIARKGLVKVGDFGFSTKIPSPDKHLTTFCGSPPYAAPELFKDEFYIGAPVDIWALGVLLYFIVSATMPFKAQNVPTLKKLIIESDFDKIEDVSDACFGLIKMILVKNPSDRCTVREIKDHLWIRDHFNIVNNSRNLLTPVRRPSQPSTEEEAFAQLSKHGITREVVDANSYKGVRSSVCATYKIMVHRLERRRGSVQSIENTPRPSIVTISSMPQGVSGLFKSKKLNFFNHHKTKVTKSRTCHIL